MPNHSHPAPTVVDLFCGVGGFSLGLAQSGFRVMGAVDNDQQVLATYRTNFPNIPVHCCDLFTATGTSVLKALGIGGSMIDLLVGGPPCQGFSVGGVRTKRDPRNKGIMSFARLVEEIRPRYFSMENVRGFLFKKHDGLRKRFAKRLKDAGYIVLPFKLLNAAEYGIPQRRQRAFVLGCLADETVPAYPHPLPGDPPTVKDAIADLATLDNFAPAGGNDIYEGELGEASSYAVRLRVGMDGRKVQPLTGCLRTFHSPDVVKRFRATAQGEQEPISMFFRLHWMKVCPTIRAGTGPEHGSHTAPRPIHPQWPRCITVREAARLHSFPDWFVFRGTRWHGFREIGNSVPPLLARAVAESISHAASNSRSS
jgi:DNA (cytosine-5)-methyltransferase 1